MIDLNRRKFLRAALFVAAAPVIVKASSLMPIRAPRFIYNEEVIFVPLLYVVTNDAVIAALRASFMQTKMIVGARVLDPIFDAECERIFPT